MVDKAQYANLEFNVDKGDLLFLYSDGLIETRDEDFKVRDFDVFEEIIKQRVSEPFTNTKELLLKIINDVEQSDNAERFEDDATLIAIKL